MEIQASTIIELYNKKIAELEHEVIMLKAQIIQLQEGVKGEEE